MAKASQSAKLGESNISVSESNFCDSGSAHLPSTCTQGWYRCQRERPYQGKSV